MKSIIISLTALAASISLSAATAFDFTDPKGVNNIRFDLDAPLEAISGTGNGISGTIHFDIANPEATQGSITLAVASMNVPNATMREHLHSADWLDAETFPEIVFTAHSVEVKEVNENTLSTHVKGELTLKGITREMTVPVTFTHLPNRLGDRTGGRMQGDLLVVRSQFSINRSDFGIKPGEMENVVAPEIQISLSVAGAAPR